MQLKVLSSGSVGNCYLLENENECLIIDLGIRFRDIKKALGFNLNKVAGCIVSHEHGDHAKGIPEAVNSGLDVYMSDGTSKALGFDGHHRVKGLKHYRVQKLGTFEVLPFNVKHDCAEPMGFLIRHPDCGTICFITDSLFVEYNFPALDHMIIEANYCEKIVHDHIISGRLANYRADRVICNHMSIQTAEKFIKTQDLSQVKNILLIHLSDTNSNALDFKNKIEGSTAKKTYTASKGLVLNLNKTPF